MRSTLEEAVDGRRSFYVFNFINLGEPAAQLVEKIWIDRTDLQVSRKQMFGKDGKMDLNVEYSGYEKQGEIEFPKIILIQLPGEDVALKMTFQKTTLNEKLAADAFNLQRPLGSELVQLETKNNTQ